VSTDRKPTAKVLFRVESPDGSVDLETLWAHELGGDQYELANSPFYAYSVSWEDIVDAPLDRDEGLATFKRVLRKSGNRTVRVQFEAAVEKGNASDAVLQSLVALGCSYEGSNRRLISINLPPGVELESIRQYLIETGVLWEHADPTYDELFPDAPD
jgi:hypothetical protein